MIVLENKGKIKDFCISNNIDLNSILFKFYQMFGEQVNNQKFHSVMEKFFEIDIFTMKNLNAHGMINYKENNIFLNKNLFIDTKHLEETFIHEVCHFFAAHLYSDFGHGKYWKMLSRISGISNKSAKYIENEEIQKLYSQDKKELAKRVYQCSDCSKKFYAGRMFKNTKYHIPCQNKPFKGKLVLIK